MDTTDFSEGQFLTPKLVSDSPIKIGVILGEARPEETKYGKQLTVNVEFNKRIKVWRLNRDSVKNMQRLGNDSQLWVGQRISFSVVVVNGKERVIGSPLLE